MKPYEDEAHKTKRAKMHALTGSSQNFESCADKAQRFACGGASASSYMPKKEGEDAPI